jgi:hypothetical protein
VAWLRETGHVIDLDYPLYTSGVIVEKAGGQVESPELPVNLVAHWDEMPRRSLASSCEM